LEKLWVAGGLGGGAGAASLPVGVIYRMMRISGAIQQTTADKHPATSIITTTTVDLL